MSSLVNELTSVGSAVTRTSPVPAMDVVPTAILSTYAVIVLGIGNAALETADSLIKHTSDVQVRSRRGDFLSQWSSTTLPDFLPHISSGKKCLIDVGRTVTVMGEGENCSGNCEDVKRRGGGGGNGRDDVVYICGRGGVLVLGCVGPMMCQICTNNPWARCRHHRRQGELERTN